ncbi:MAG: hypothetical protein LJE59_00760 [Chromatiaceae bacterium]|jgi:hypothetical protein|nr:hypothetical protein [Chromatiaceae bacterium]
MANPFRGVLLSATLVASPVALADPPATLAELPVVSMQLIAPMQYQAASDLAARGRAPLDIALKIVGGFEGAMQHIMQTNQGSEAPLATRVTVVRDGLIDDSVRGERWDIALERTLAGAWRIGEVRRAWRCWRGEHLDRFAAGPCP